MCVAVWIQKGVDVVLLKVFEIETPGHLQLVCS